MRTRLLLIFLVLSAALTVRTAELRSPPPKLNLDRDDAGRVGLLVGRILEAMHYKQAPLNDAISTAFLTNYLDTLDYNHLIFLQTDVDQLQKKHGTSLDDSIRRSDARPAFEIFELYLARLGQRHELVQKLLQEKFDFTTDETILRQRNKAPWPKDETEAELLWRARIKFELLQEKLAKTKIANNSTNQVKSADTTKSAVETARKPEPDDPAKTIQRRYDMLLRSMKDFDEEEILQVYLGALSRAYDPHTEYFNPRDAADFDINHIKLSLSGIGARLRWEDGYTRIENLLPGGPAEISKQLKPNDRIVAVAQGEAEPVDAVEMKLKKVVGMIRGPRGTEVRLTIIPAGADESERRIVTLIRDEIKLKEQLAQARVVDHPDAEGRFQRLGVISLPQFYDKCTRDIEKLIGRLKEEKITGLVLDLRRNGGGLLDEAISLTGLFIPEGPVVQVRDNRRETQVFEDTDTKVAYDGPLVVLVSRMSASASEIIAAALQDYGRAIIVGDQSTHGKGTVQSMLSLKDIIRGENLPDPGKLKLTVSKFYRIAGGTTQKNGVTPDIVLPSIYDYMEIGEAHLPNALPADKIDPVHYEPFTSTKVPLAELRGKSSNRLQKDPDFSYLHEDIERLKKQREEKTITVNEAKLRKEKDEQESRDKQRKDERTERKPTNEKVFTLSVEMVDQGKPMQATAVMKQKENDQLASVQPIDQSDADDPDSAADPIVDAQLNEALNILNDYLALGGLPAGRLTSTVKQPLPKATEIK